MSSMFDSFSFTAADEAAVVNSERMQSKRLAKVPTQQSAVSTSTAAAAPADIAAATPKASKKRAASASTATDDVGAAGAAGNASSRADEEAQRRNAAHLIVVSMANKVGDEEAARQAAALEEGGAELPVHKKFKALIGVDSGSTLRGIEAGIRAANPNMPETGVRAEAKIALKEKSKERKRHAWQTNAADSAILAALRTAKDAPTQQFVREFEDRAIELSAATPDEAVTAASFNELRRTALQRAASTAASVTTQANALLSGGTPPLDATESSAEEEQQPPPPHRESTEAKTVVAPLQLTVTNRAPLNETPLRAVAQHESPNGLVAGENAFGDVLYPGVKPFAMFAEYFAAGKARNEESLGNDGARFLQRFHTHSVNEFMKMLDSAPADACLTASGARPSGSLVQDLRLVLEEHDYDASCLSNERLLKYQALWQQTHTPDPADVENALAVRAAHINREKAVEVMRRLGMPEEDIASAMAHGKSAETASFMRYVFSSLNTETFVRAEKQAEEQTHLAARVAAAAKRSAKQPSANTGNRGLEALGLAGAVDGSAAVGADGAPPPTLKVLGVQLERVKKSYIQSFMRPAVLENERPCVNGENCVCLTMATQFPAMSAPEGRGCGFVGREFLLPSQLSTLNAHGTLPKLRAMCVMCDRAAVTTHVHHNIENHIEPLMPLHGFIVDFDVEGGYRRSQVIEPIGCGKRKVGIVGPYPAFNAQSLHYSKVNIDGRVYNCLIETESDFRMGSASTPRI